ncbi:glycosyltransferase [Lysinibacillus capsici]|uniref:glycosyltransferase n=1 Tax=Lysinibacillus capsici TaxID=2115968 RepID=UPI001CDA51AD|nr:glycosyltransferase [Lysinibacillus capsici]
MLENKKSSILLTCHSLVDYAGAEINATSLAIQLEECGFDVEIATLQFGYPIKDLINKKKITVKNILIEELEKKEYDIIWSHHVPILNYLILEKEIKAEKVIFSSLSPFEPLEFPPIYANELTLCLANSMETYNQLKVEGVNEEKIRLFPNYAPKSYFEKSRKEFKEKINRVCIVSNHVTAELQELYNYLEQEQIELDIYGINYTPIEITEELLLNYDAVITIGKTVQYCLALKIPVFCYDVHGGPGWINEKNYDKAKYYNFSGRGFGQKYNTEEIKKQIIKGYNDTLKSVDLLYQKAIDEFNLEKNIYILLSEIRNNREKVNFEKIKKLYPIRRSNQAFLREYEYNNYRKNLIKDLEHSLYGIKDNIFNEIIVKNFTDDSSFDKFTNNLKRDINFTKKVNDNLSLELIVDEIKEEIKLLKELIEEKDVRNKHLLALVEEKEANNKYLLELVEEKNRKMLEMTSTKLWMYGEKFRRGLIKTKSVVKNPKKIANKILRKPNLVNVRSYNNTSLNLNDPLVSVVIPIYDREDVLIESIESILNQTYKNIELILVCDGSPENTLKIVDRYKINPKVRIYKFNNNSGNAVRGRNKAIKEARGEYLAFQDSDDIAEPNRIQLSLDYLIKYKVDVVYGGWRAIVEESREIDLQDKQEVYSPDCDYEFLKQICVPCQSTVMVRLEPLRKVGGLKTKMRYREDHELWLRLAYNGYKFKAIPEILTNLRLHEGNLELSFKENDDKWEKLTLQEHKIIERMKPKIGYVVSGTGISGGLAVICQHANQLLKRGYDVYIYTEDGTNSIEWFPNQQVQVLPIKEIPDNLDIVIATYWKTAYTIKSIPASKKYYFIQSDESKFFSENSPEYKAALQTYQMNYEFITMAKWIQTWLKDTFGKDSFYVPNGVDLDIMKPSEPLIPKGSKVRVLLEGPIDVPFKGMKEAFEVVKDLDCEVVCVSTAGIPKKEWKCDYLYQNVPMDRMRYIYSSCDILLKMSKVESFCLPALEMMACGNTCVVNKFNGIDEFVIDGLNGKVVELGNVEQAKVALEELINNEKLRKTFSKNALKTAGEWNWDKSINKLEKIFIE